jgi:hypothetical protein
MPFASAGPRLASTALSAPCPAGPSTVLGSHAAEVVWMQVQALELDAVSGVARSLMACWIRQSDQVAAIAGALTDTDYRGPAADRDRARLERLARSASAWAQETEMLWTRLQGLLRALESGPGQWLDP